MLNKDTRAAFRPGKLNAAATEYDSRQARHRPTIGDEFVIFIITSLLVKAPSQLHFSGCILFSVPRSLLKRRVAGTRYNAG